MGTCLRNHLMMHEMKEGRGPIFMDTPTAMANLAANMTPRKSSTSKRRLGKISST